MPAPEPVKETLVEQCLHLMVKILSTLFNKPYVGCKQAPSTACIAISHVTYSGFAFVLFSL